MHYFKYAPHLDGDIFDFKPLLIGGQGNLLDQFLVTDLPRYKELISPIPEQTLLEIPNQASGHGAAGSGDLECSNVCMTRHKELV